MKDLIAKIENKTAKIAVIGMGYVGLPLALTFANEYQVVGYDIKSETINSLLEGKSHIKDVKEEKLLKYLDKTFIPTSNHNDLEKCDFIFICVPTPLMEEKEPDLSFIRNACDTISLILRRGHFVVLESTTYPGTTEELVVPILEKNGLKAGIDFGVAYSPERVDPGSNLELESIPKIVSGINQECTDIIAKLYGSVITDVVQVKDCRTAEATKIFENIFRNVNIALVNEFALICEKMDINVWNVIDAAATKPYGFMAFYPGPGVGGHCIPLDPYYLSYKAKKYGIIPRFIEMSGEINDYMKIHTVNLVSEGLKQIGKKISNSNIAVLGLAYKKNIDDTRESPVKKIIEEIMNLGGSIKVYDPYAKSIGTRFGKIISEKSLDDAVKSSNCIVFTVDHSEFKKIDLKRIKQLMENPIIVDCKNIFDDDGSLNDFIYLCIGKPLNRC